MSSELITNENKNLNRQSNFELLRIVAMFFIVISHCCAHEIFNHWRINLYEFQYINSLFVVLFSSLGKIAVNLFVFLTGYYMVYAQARIYKFSFIYLKTLLYSLIFLLITLIIKGYWQVYNISIFPIIGKNYWFITDYLLMYLFIPYINIFLNVVNKKTLKLLLITIFIIWVIAPSFFSFKCEINGFIWFICAYIIGACIRKNIFSFNLKYNKMFFIVLFFLFFSVLCFYIGNYILDSAPIMNFSNVYNILFSEYKISCLVISLYLFYLFKNCEIKYNIYINWIAKSMLGVYLIHDNMYVRDFLFKDLINTVSYTNSFFYILLIILIAFSIFIISIFLDKILSYLFDNTIKKYSIIIETKISSLINKISD